MVRLKDRNKSIPNGYRFYIAELKWNGPGNYPSFTKVCDAVQRVVEANPFLAQKHNWPQDRHGVEEWVDSYNAALCLAMGWEDYVASDAATSSLPKWSPPDQQTTLQSLRNAAALAKQLVAGAKSLTEWDDSGEPAVPRDQATARALICSTCPRNDTGSLTAWFTVPAAELIKRRIEKAQSRALSTIHDEKLHLCSACACPLQLKVHVPLPWITKRMSPEVKAKLDPNCWILHET